MKSTALAGASLVGVLLVAGTVASAGFDLQAHRGGRGLAPENTLAAFARALSLGVTTREMDLGVTADGVVVVSHDPELNPDLTRDAARHPDQVAADGQRVPRLADVFGLAAQAGNSAVRFNV